jgi:hypothetical protein
MQTHFNTYYALDTNGDGKSDLVRVWRKYYKPNWTINDHNTQWQVTSYVNNIGNTAVTGNKFQLDYTTPCQSIGWLQNCNHDHDCISSVYGSSALWIEKSGSHY